MALGDIEKKRKLEDEVVQDQGQDDSSSVSIFYVLFMNWVNNIRTLKTKKSSTLISTTLILRRSTFMPLRIFSVSC